MSIGETGLRNLTPLTETRHPAPRSKLFPQPARGVHVLQKHGSSDRMTHLIPCVVTRAFGVARFRGAAALYAGETMDAQQLITLLQLKSLSEGDGRAPQAWYAAPMTHQHMLAFLLCLAPPGAPNLTGDWRQSSAGPLASCSSVRNQVLGATNA